MKLLITLLTMIFISFGVKAMEIERLYKMCKPYQTNGFSSDTLSRVQQEYASICIAYLKGVVDIGFVNCLTLHGITKSIEIPSSVIGVLQKNANKEPSTYASLITSFINFAENNTNLWDKFVSAHTPKFLGNKFPCNYKNP